MQSLDLPTSSKRRVQPSRVPASMAVEVNANTTKVEVEVAVAAAGSNQDHGLGVGKRSAFLESWLGWRIVDSRTVHHRQVVQTRRLPRSSRK